MSVFTAPRSAALLADNYLLDEDASIATTDANTHPSFPETNLLLVSRGKFWLVTSNNGGAVGFDLGSARRPTVLVLFGYNGVINNPTANYRWVLQGADDSAMSVNLIEWDFFPYAADACRYYLGADKVAGVALYSPTISEYATGVSVQSDGKLAMSMLTLNLNFEQLRLLPDGDLDLAFNSGSPRIDTDFSSATDFSFDVTTDANNKRLLCGSAVFSGESRVAIARYNEDGSLDTAFNTTGKYSASIAVGSDQLSKIIALSNTDVFAVGFSANGSNQNAFAIKLSASGGSVVNDARTFSLVSSQWNGLVELGGSVYCVGKTFNSTTSRWVIARQTPGLTGLNTSFNGTGSKEINFGASTPQDEAFDVTRTADSNIVVVGSAQLSAGYTGWALAKFTPAGVKDSTFGGAYNAVPYDWGAATGLRCVKVLTDGSIIAGGNINKAGVTYGVVAKFSATGILDPSFGDAGICYIPVGGTFAVVYDIVILSDNRIVAVGGVSTGAFLGFSGFTARITTGGVLDSSFSPTVLAPPKRYWRLTMGFSANTPANSRLGYIYLGDYIDIRPEPGGQLVVEDKSGKFSSYSGVMYGDPVKPRRTATFSQKFSTKAESKAMREYLSGVGASKPVVLDFFGNATDDDRNQGCFYGYLDRSGGFERALDRAGDDELKFKIAEVPE